MVMNRRDHLNFAKILVEGKIGIPRLPCSIDCLMTGSVVSIHYQHLTDSHHLTNCCAISPQCCQQSSTVEGLFITLIEHLQLQRVTSIDCDTEIAGSVCAVEPLIIIHVQDCASSWIKCGCWKVLQTLIHDLFVLADFLLFSLVLLTLHRARAKCSWCSVYSAEYSEN